MQFSKPIPKNNIEKTFLAAIESDTPAKVKDNNLLDLNNKQPFSFTIKQEHLAPFNDGPEALGLIAWFDNYKKEAKVSTAGIRGLQNPLYPWDTRYPLNLIGVMLATMGKVLVAKELNQPIIKLAGSEVRYNSPQYIELIARIQAAYGIKTYIPAEYKTLTVFMSSFLIFMNDLYGGEYVTSSHSMCKKIATKDLNTQGSQYVPSESLLFVDKVEQILKEVQEKGEYTIQIAAADDPLIDRTFLADKNSGVDDYVKYLQDGIATPANINHIKNLIGKVVIDTVGGSFTRTMAPVFTALGVREKFDIIHSEEDPFNHCVGKVIGEDGKVFDWTCDPIITQVDLKTMDIKTPVVNSVNYTEILKDYPIGTAVLFTDPDADRLITATIDSKTNIPKLKELGLIFAPLNDDRVLVIFTPNQSFLMNMDFQHRALREADLWEKYNWFVIKTTASQPSWDKWAKQHNIPVINTPVGFKELADTMISTEKKIHSNTGKDIVINDVYGNPINIGKNPRLLFAGEESGGEIFGAPDLISSKSGRKAISMREKSAGEAVIITAAMLSWLESKNMNLIDYLIDIYDESDIDTRFEIRVDQKYYNESEPDINILLREKEHGMLVKEENKAYFMSIALAMRDNLIKIEQVREILSECFADLDFNDLNNIQCCGDGIFLTFANKSLEIRPSGTDAVNKCYCWGKDLWECIKFAQIFDKYEGQRTVLHKKYIPEELYTNAEKLRFEYYSNYKDNL